MLVTEFKKKSEYFDKPNFTTHVSSMPHNSLTSNTKLIISDCGGHIFRKFVVALSEILSVYAPSAVHIFFPCCGAATQRVSWPPHS